MEKDLYWIKNLPLIINIVKGTPPKLEEKKLSYSYSASVAALRMLKRLTEDHLPTKGE